MDFFGDIFKMIDIDRKYIEKTLLKLDKYRLDETVWLTQTQMSELFQTTLQNITLHIGNIYKEAELEQIST